jgi:hypothetical protein
MDFANLKISDVATLKLKHPKTGAIIEGAELDLIGRDSKQFKAFVIEEARLQAQGIKQSAEDVDASSFKRAIQLTAAIRGIEESGKPITDPAHLYATYPWVLEQAQLFILTRSNFLLEA